MIAAQHITAILKEWMEMTRREAQAIRAGDWSALRQTQEAKAGLRIPLSEAMEQWTAENPEEANSQPFRDEISKLLALETRNGDLLADRKRQAREKQLLLEQALFNLRRIRSSYAKRGNAVINSCN
jgi:hypothetical protein